MVKGARKSAGKKKSTTRSGGGKVEPVINDAEGERERKRTRREEKKEEKAFEEKAAGRYAQMKVMVSNDGGGGDVGKDDDEGRDASSSTATPQLTLAQELEMYKRKNEILRKKLSETEDKIPKAIITRAGLDSETNATTITRDDNSSVGGMSKRTVGGSLTEASQLALLKETKTMEEIEEKLGSYVNKTIFRGCKFPIGLELERKVCRMSVVAGKVTLPEGVTKEVFGEECSLIVRMRMRKLRSNCHSTAKGKFEHDWKAQRVPDNFKEKLFDGYRNYLDENGEVIPGREGNLEAFIYFVDRILTSINSRVNKYGPEIRKVKLLGKVFSISDEAFALILVENYYQRWVRLLEAGLTKEPPEDEEGGESTDFPKGWFRARYTSSAVGRLTSGWSQEGIDKFGDYVDEVREARGVERKGEQLDKYVRNYWLGIKKRKPKKQQQAVPDAWKDDSLFGGEMAEV